MEQFKITELPKTIVGIKLICELSNGAINTWHAHIETTIEDLINNVKHSKRWMGGKFYEIYLEFDFCGKYYKVYIDVNKNGYNKLLIK